MVPKNFPDRSVCVVGLGYVGLPLAVVLAHLGFDVIGVEVREDVLKMLAEGRPHVFEPSLAEQLRRVTQLGNLTLAQRIPDKCRATTYIITVGTPLGDDGVIRLDMIKNVAEEISRQSPPNSMVVVRSTVRVGTTRNVVAPILRASGKDYDVTFCPERILAGAALRELTSLPQVVGGETLDATFRAARFFQLITPTVVRVSTLEAAEMIKLVDNTQRDVIFGFSNEVAKVCDALGISASEVIQAGKLGYPRTNLPMPGPVGGPCLTKDPHILAQSVQDLGVVPEMALAARRINESQPADVVTAIAGRLSPQAFPKKPIVCLLGVAFKGKPDTDDLRGTMAIPLMNALRKQFPDMVARAYDPVVPSDRIEALGYAPYEDAAEAMEGAHLVIVQTNHPKIAALPFEDLAERMGNPGLIYDFWNLFSAADLRLPDSVGYAGIGSHGAARLAGRGTAAGRA